MRELKLKKEPIPLCFEGSAESARGGDTESDTLPVGNTLFWGGGHPRRRLPHINSQTLPQTLRTPGLQTDVTQTSPPGVVSRD